MALWGLLTTMKFVSETVIDQVIDTLEDFSDDQYERAMSEFSEAQPVIFSWLFSDQFDLLNDDEKGYLQYLALICWRSIIQVNGDDQPEVSEEQLGTAEEVNYGIMENSTGKNLRDRLTIFFNDTPQEDLLAFAEDAVLEEEDDPESLVTRDGREPIFIALKTMVDVLTTN